jgi:hypothetical protein
VYPVPAKIFAAFIVALLLLGDLLGRQWSGNGIRKKRAN